MGEDNVGPRAESIGKKHGWSSKQSSLSAATVTFESRIA